MRSLLLLLVGAVFFSEAALNSTEFQPQVRIVEHRNLAYGSVSFAEGSPWCGGNMTFWMVGHQNDETPFCYDETIDQWTLPRIAVLDNNDEMNDLDGNPEFIDRHACTSLDVDRDGVLDLICVVGADRGNGTGYTELYLTQPDGSLAKVLNHGLQKYPTVRSRYIKVLRNTVDEGSPTHVVIAAYGTYRDDQAMNQHAVFRLIDGEPYFEEVPGPYNIHGKASQLTVADWNQDGRDDFVINHMKTWSEFFEQKEDGTFKRVRYPRGFRTNKMVASRFADMNGDGIIDLVALTKEYKNAKRGLVGPKMRIFLGVEGKERFDFSQTWYTRHLRYAAPDLEILDVNQDGIPDVYVVQSDESDGSYCGQRLPYEFADLPEGWMPPIDEAADTLFVGKPGKRDKKHRFKAIRVDTELHGCGYLVEKFGDNKTMILANGDHGHPGSNAILSW